MKYETKPVPADAFRIVQVGKLRGGDLLMTLEDGTQEQCPVSVSIAVDPPIGLGSYYIVPEGETNGVFMNNDEFQRKYSKVTP